MKVFSTLCAALCLSVAVWGQTGPGSIVFTAFDADGEDGFSFVTLQQIPDGFTIYFTDKEWDGNAFQGSEGVVSWANSTGVPISAGSVITLQSVQNASISSDVGTAARPELGMDLSGADEVLYAYLASPATPSTPTSFLAAISNDATSPFFVAGSGVLTNTGLTNGITATAITGDEDVAVFIGSISCDGNAETIQDCAAKINSADADQDTNWSTADGSGDQSTDSTAPDFPADSPTAANFTINNSSSYGILPIALTAFGARPSGEAVALYWQTATELNNDYMAVERSADGRAFTEIGRVAGAGTTQEAQGYQFTDRQPLPGRSYYRLRQADFDGQAEYHGPVAVTREGGKATLSLYPTIAQGQVQVQFGGLSGQSGSLQLIGSDGRVWLTQPLPEGTAGQLSISTTHLPAGLYWARLQGGQDAPQARLIVR
ncbi:T9SS type A sorting domain-containing protein [Phaeodactylibacter luteus]|uniref:T9SS type A sorting domain-containing protein n=1 Tax=Phaeodactylibacter luteus TaxID=1564516 RepID=A0A5C6RIL4_9BACT|nr:hypothetical protein [Phaeodactylibacter luteus]TXB60606.1 hypothetical protein FRY97_20270 [Phaeodactylibacter luteus]